MLDCPAGFVVLLGGDLEKGEDIFAFLIAFKFGVAKKLMALDVGLSFYKT